MLNSMNVKEFIAYYIKVVLEGDLKKMLAVAQQSQEADEREAISRMMHTPSATTASTTMSPGSPSFYNQFDSDRARCAIPVAMTLFSVIDVMGILLKPNYHADARDSIERFFEYAYQKAITSSALTKEESGVLNQVFRNGCMHSFFPSGMNIRLDVKDTDSKPLLPNATAHTITLNVNYMQKIVVETVNALFIDDSLHPAMQILLDAWILATYDTGRTKDRLDEFWNNRPY